MAASGWLLCRCWGWTVITAFEFRNWKSYGASTLYVDPLTVLIEVA